MSKFETLRIWQESRQIVNEIYAIFKTSKDFSFKDQIQRASISIINNIAEGSESGTDNLNIRYLHIAKGSCAEVKSMLYLSEDFGFCNHSKAEELREKLNTVIFGIHKMIHYLKEQRQ
ncbi:MAG: ribosomal protein [Bacteroidetes bacterium]|nr:ribosomal protein [Bacteroidota bacterium]